jgi:hypothetical protein
VSEEGLEDCIRLDAGLRRELRRFGCWVAMSGGSREGLGANLGMVGLDGYAHSTIQRYRLGEMYEEVGSDFKRHYMYGALAVPSRS